MWCLKKFYESLHKTFRGTTKKCENKKCNFIFSLRPGLGQEKLMVVETCFLRLLYLTCKMLLKVNYLVADKDKSLICRVFYRSRDDLFVRVCRIPVNLIQSVPNVMFWTISYQLYNLKNVKNTHGGVLLLVKMQTFSL